MADNTDKITFSDEARPHQRYNPLLDEWVLVSPQRALRPWTGQTETPVSSPPASSSTPTTSTTNNNSTTTNTTSSCSSTPTPNTSSSSCQPSATAAQQLSNPLCPGGVRANGTVTPDYRSTYVFDNDFPALLDFADDSECDPASSADPLFKQCAARGTCRVMCFHPDSQKTIALMSLVEVEAIVRTWAEQWRHLAERYVWVQIFENRGAAMGCSNQHPHCQIWATAFLPSVPRRKHDQQRRYCRQHGSVMLIDYLARELEKQERVVCSNESFVALVPYWAVWPYETMLLPRRHVQQLHQLTAAEQQQLAQLLRQLLIRYDNLFSCTFPYSMGWHGAPASALIGEDCSYWQLHAVFYPPLLRSAYVKKFMVGFEMLAQPQRDITPETAAAHLRNCSDTHYSLA